MTKEFPERAECDFTTPGQHNLKRKQAALSQAQREFWDRVEILMYQSGGDELHDSIVIACYREAREKILSIDL